MVWGGLPGCFWRGLGMLVTQVCGHMRILQGCRFPSRKFCLVSQIWMPPSGVFGRVLAGTRARQYRPTWWILSMAWAENTIEFRMNAKWTQFIIKCPNEERLLECCWVIETFICFIRRVNRPKPHHKKRKMLIEYWHEATLKVYVIYLQYSTHPLEAVLLTGVGPLLCHNHDPLIIKHRHWEHSDPGGMTTEKWGLTHTHTCWNSTQWKAAGCFTEILQFWGDTQEPFFFFFTNKISNIIADMGTCIAEMVFFWFTLLGAVSVSPPPVNCFHRLHCECRGYQVISVVPPPAHHQQPLNLPNNKH